MRGVWLWDRKTTEAQAKKVLRDPDNKAFTAMAALLLSRKNNPREVLKEYIDPLVLCQYWAAIKRKMRQDKWADPRIIFWQVVYERLAERYRAKGIVFRKEAPKKEPICVDTGKKISDMRREQGMSQKKFAKKIGVSQQLISRIEKGRENVSIVTLTNISRALGKNVRIDFMA